MSRNWNLGFAAVRFSAAVALGCFLTAAVPAAAQDGGPVVLIDDATPGVHFSGLDPAGLASAGDAVYFWGFEEPTGREMWRSDGTAAGTRIVSDFCPGRCSSAPYDRDYPLNASAHPPKPLVVDDRIYFLANDDLPRTWIVTSDGTPEGTVGLKDFVRTSYDLVAVGPVAFGGAVYFLANDEQHGLEVWRTDGTPEGTLLALDFVPGPDSGVWNLASTDDRLFLEPWEYDAGIRVWDGAGTPSVELPGERPGLLTTAGGRVFYSSYMEQRYWLFSSDGTVQGTRSMALQSRPTAAVEWRDELFFVLESSKELYRSDGTQEGTETVLSADEGIASLSVSQDQLFVDTPVTTVLYNPGFLEIIVDHQILRLEDPSAEPEPWVRSYESRPEVTGLGDTFVVAGRFESDSEPTLATVPATGTDLNVVRRAEEAESTFPVPLGASGEDLLYEGMPGNLFSPDLATYYEFFLAGKEPGSTRLLRAPFSDDGGFVEGLLVRPRSLEIAGATWVLGSHGIFRVAEGDRLLRLSDMVVFGETAAFVGEEVYFLAWTKLSGEVSLWTSDGRNRREVATLFKSPLPLCEQSPTCPLPERNAFAVDGRYLFQYGSVVGRSDGTAAGTSFALSLPPSLDLDLQFESPSRLGDTLVFAASNVAAGLQAELWRMDDLSQEPVLWRRLHLPLPARFFWEGLRPLVDMTVFRGELYFADGDPATGVELWKSDGTEEGTSLFLDLRPGPASSHPRGLVAAGDRLYFAADDGASGHELWSTDGTVEGTALVADVHPGPGSSYPQQLTAVEVEGPGGEAVQRLLFAARGARGGLEPWTSDGTLAGTRRLQDVAPGPLPSSPSRFFPLGPNVYLSAWSEDAGFELRVLPRDALLAACDFAVSPASAAVPSGGGTVEVTVEAEEGCLWDAGSEASWILAGGGTHDGAGTVELTVSSNDGDARAATVRVAGRDFAVTQEAAPPPEPSCPECLLDGRFTVEVAWKNFRVEGQVGQGTPIPFSEESVLFYFFKESNVELIVKVLDGRRTNGHFWVFYGGLSDVEYTITVTDTETGQARTYHNPPGEICGGADVRAF